MKKKSILLPIVLGVIALGGIVYAVIKLMPKKDEGKKDSSNSETNSGTNTTSGSSSGSSKSTSSPTSGKTECPFPNKEKESEFRKWMKTFYPTWKDSKGEPLDYPSQYFCTRTVKEAYQKYGVEYFNYQKIMQGKTPTNSGFGYGLNI